MSYSLHLLESSAASARPVLPLDGRVTGLRFAFDQHGAADLQATLQLSLAEQFRIYNRSGAPHVVVAYAGRPCWVGRLESATVASGPMTITASGYARALSDVAYTAAWADYTLANWGVDAPNTTVVNERYEISTANNRISIATRKGETYSNGTNFALLRWFGPSGGVRDVTHVGLTYDLTMPANWQIVLRSGDEGYASTAALWTHNASGANQTGSQFLTLGTPRDYVYLIVYNNTGGASTPAGDTGANFVNIAIQYVTTRAVNVYATQIVEGLAAYVNSLNPTQLAAAARATQVPAANGRTYEIYEDRLPADILDELCRQEQYQWWVDLAQQLVFEPRGTGAQTWHIAAGSLQIERALDRVWNRRYGVYQEAGGRPLRTATAENSASIARYGVTRSASVDLQTTDATAAESYRDLALADSADPTPRSLFVINQLRGTHGQPVPLHLSRAGDTAVVQNIPVGLSSGLDQLSRFRIARAEVALTRGNRPQLTLEPADPIPTLESTLAKLEILR